MTPLFYLTSAAQICAAGAAVLLARRRVDHRSFAPDRPPITPTKLSPAPAPLFASPSPPVEADEPEIPPALVGPRILAHLTAFADVMGKTPVFVLRAAIVQGLTGGEPLFTMEDLATLRRVIAAEQAEGGPIPGTLGRGPDSGPRAG